VIFSPTCFDGPHGGHVFRGIVASHAELDGAEVAFGDERLGVPGECVQRLDPQAAAVVGAHGLHLAAQEPHEG